MHNGGKALRERAAEIIKLRKNIDEAQLKSLGLDRLVEELSIYQVELELQNEELLRSQEKAFELQEKYRNLFETAPTAYLTLDEELHILAVNQTFCRTFQVEKPDILGKPFTRFIHPDAQDHFYLHCRKIFETNASGQCQLRLQHQGITLDMHIDYCLIPTDYQNKAIRLSLSDISARREQEKRLEYQAALLNATGSAVIATDIQGVITYWNQAATELYGWTAEEVLGKQITTVTPSNQTRSEAEIIMERLRNGLSWEGQFMVKDKNGRVFPAHVKDVPVLNEQKQLIGIIGNSFDLSEKKAREEKIHQLAEERHNILESISDGFFVLDAQMIVEYFNSQAQQLLGKRKEEVIGRQLFEVFPEAIGSVFEELYQHCIEKQEFREIETYFGKKPYQNWYNVRVHPKQGGITVFFQVITERKQAEALLKSNAEDMARQNEEIMAQNEELRTQNEEIIQANTDLSALSSLYVAERNKAQYMLDIAGVMFVSLDEGGKISLLNKKAEAVLGFPQDEVLGKDWIDTFVPEDQRVKVRKVLQSILKGETAQTDYVENEVLTKSGEKRIIAWHNRLMKNEQGGIVGTLSSGEDITEQRAIRQQLEKALEKAEESDRLKSAFLANISHEIRTPMNGILGFANLLQEKNINPEDQTRYIEIIRKSGERMLRIINDIIDISRIESGQARVNPGPVEIHSLLTAIRDFFRPLSDAKKIELETQCQIPESLETIWTDAGKLHSILSNLINNAIKFTEKGKVKLACSLENDHLLFRVSDTGMGIPPEMAESIFDRFRQADHNIARNYEGAGLGLAISRGFAKLLQGELYLESQPGKGSTFILALPLQLPPSSQPKTEKLADIPLPLLRPLKMLIVEDNEESDLLLTIQLKPYASEILHAVNGQEAVDCCLQHPDLDVVFMDIKLPVKDGYTATREIRSFNKDVVIIGQTAFAQKGDREKVLDCGCNDYVPKPINKRVIMEVLQKFF
jgi:hypothetical protein